MEKHFLLSPKFINIVRNLKVLPLLLLIQFALVFHLRRSEDSILVVQHLLYLLCGTDKTKVNYKSEIRLRLIKRIFFIDHQIILDSVKK